MSTPSRIYNPSLTLMTDLYELTMAYAYWKAGMGGHEATFVLSFRKPPFNGGYTVACGLAYVVDYITHFGFTDSDLSYLETLRGNDDHSLFEPGGSSSTSRTSACRAMWTPSRKGPWFSRRSRSLGSVDRSSRASSLNPPC